jgi:hypothetical protein
MNLNILIVEDQFLEADNLSIILKNAGHSEKILIGERPGKAIDSNF